MKANDKKLFHDIQEWLTNDDGSDESVLKGARIVLQLNRNKMMYSAATRKPSAMASKIRYEMQKHLKYYTDGLTLKQVVKMDRQLTEEVGTAIEQQKKVVETEEPESMANEIERRRGKRADHETLHESIRRLWDINAERWKRIEELFFTCKSITEPCDRYEYLSQLKEIWYKYKADMRTYDEATPGSIYKTEESESMSIVSARSYISRYLSVIEEEITDGTDTKRREEVKENIQKRVEFILSSGEGIKKNTVERLIKAGIEIHGQGTQGK